MRLFNAISSLPAISAAFSLGSYLANQAGSLVLSSQACETLAAVTSTASSALSFAATPGLALMGAGMVYTGVKMLMARQNELRPRVRARPSPEGGLSFYRDPVPLKQKILKVAKKVIPAALTIYFGYSLASRMGSLGNEYQSVADQFSKLSSKFI